MPLGLFSMIQGHIPASQSKRPKSRITVHISPYPARIRRPAWKADRAGLVRYSQRCSRCGELTQATTHAGDRGLILAIFYSNTSEFATTIAESVAKGYAKNNLVDFRTISARNPPIIPKPEPTCGRSHFCTKASHCRGALACICVADRWYGEYYTSTCKYPLPGGQSGRGLLDFDSTNATGPAFSINETSTAALSANLACPCNCTYVSEACCNSLSGIVYEAPDLKLGSVRAPSENVTCNATTGDFQASSMVLDVMLTPR